MSYYNKCIEKTVRQRMKHEMLAFMYVMWLCSCFI